MLSKRLMVETLTGISEMIGKPVSEAVMKIYYAALKDMPDEQFRKATDVIIATRKFTSIPLPAEWLEQVTSDKAGQAIEAWQKIENAMARIGAYQTVMFDDPLIHGFIQSQEGGWPGVCATSLENMKWLRKDFEKYYQAMNPEKVDCRPLVGISEGENIKLGYEHDEEPVMIGNSEVCRALIDYKPEGEVLKKLGFEEDK